MSTQSARRIAAVLTGTALLGAGLGVPAADARTTSLPKRCSALKGKDLLPGNPKIKVVSRRYVTNGSGGLRFRGRIVLGCTTRNSRVRRLGLVGSDYDGSRAVNSSTYSVGRSAGTWLVERSLSENEMGSYEKSRSVLNVATGKSYTVWVDNSEVGGAGLPPVAATALDATGRSVVIFAGETDGDTSELPPGATSGVATFTSTGTTGLPDSGRARYADYKAEGGRLLSFEQWSGDGSWEVSTGSAVGTHLLEIYPAGTAAGGVA